MLLVTFPTLASQGPHRTISHSRSSSCFYERKKYLKHKSVEGFKHTMVYNIYIYNYIQYIHIHIYIYKSAASLLPTPRIQGGTNRRIFWQNHHFSPRKWQSFTYNSLEQSCKPTYIYIYVYVYSAGQLLRTSFWNFFGGYAPST